MISRRGRFLYGMLFLAPYLCLFIAFVAWPIGYGLVVSFLQWEMLTRLPPRWAGFDNYRQVLGDRSFWHALGVTLHYVLLAVPLKIGGALLIALGLAGLGARRLQWLRGAYFLPTLISVSVAGLVWRWFYSTEFGLFNAYLGRVGVVVPWISSPDWALRSIALMSAWWSLGGPMIILLAGLLQIPGEYYEAAAIDGASAAQRLRHVTLPLLRPVLLFAIVIVFIGAFQVFGQVYVITPFGRPENSTRVLMYYIYETAFQQYRLGYGAAMSWLLFLLIMAASVVQVRLMRERA